MRPVAKLRNHRQAPACDVNRGSALWHVAGRRREAENTQDSLLLLQPLVSLRLFQNKPKKKFIKNIKYQNIFIMTYKLEMGTG